MLINENILVNLILKPFGSMEVVHKSISLLVSVCVCVCINKYMHMCVLLHICNSITYYMDAGNCSDLKINLSFISYGC